MKRLNHCVRLFRIVLFLILLTLSFASCNNFQSGDESDTANTVGDSLSETTVETLTEAPTEPETKHTHAFGDWVIMFDATCTEEGRQERTCACGEKDIQTITSMGHTEEVIAGKMATCIDTGLTEGKKCSVCGEIVKAQEIIPAGHDYNTTIWSSDDEQHWHKCRNCDAITDAADHTFIGKTCTVCGYAFQAGSEGLIFISNKDGTCYVSGIGTCQDTDVVIPPVSPAGDKVKSIAYQAFRNCERLTSITIPNSVTSIDERAFFGCNNLTTINIGNNVKSIGDGAFCCCYRLTNFTIPNSVTRIGEETFFNCYDLTSVTIGNNVKSIGFEAFCDCHGLKSITIPDSVTKISDGAFLGCTGLTSITIPDSVKSIGEWAFYNCKSLTSITIPQSVTNIGEGAFNGCIGLTSITIPGSVTSIGRLAFERCTGLTSIIIPGSVTRIEYGAFGGCRNLTIYCEAASKPSGWYSDWNYSNCPVIWGYTGN